jgi:cytochrome c biogenesis protein CcmG, thiol:disulfide interchange protein DsbE
VLGVSSVRRGLRRGRDRWAPERAEAGRPRRGRGWLAVVPVAALGGLVLGALGATTRFPEAPPFSADRFRPAPDFTLSLLRGGGSTNLSDLRGHPILLNFWASWCHPCRQEAPVLAAAWREWRDTGVTFLGVDSNDTRSAAIDFEDRYGIEFRSVVDNDGDVNYAYGVTGTPQTFFIDAKGLILGEYAGPIDQPTLDAYLSALLRRAS